MQNQNQCTHNIPNNGKKVKLNYVHPDTKEIFQARKIIREFPFLADLLFKERFESYGRPLPEDRARLVDSPGTAWRVISEAEFRGLVDWEE